MTTNQNETTPDIEQASNGEDVVGNSSVDQSFALKAEVEKFKKDYLYLLAEFENHKKHMIKERSELRKFGAERLIVDLLGVLDIFDTALGSEMTAENIGNFRKGIEMTASELRSVLQRHGVEEIPAEGKPFDPAIHEALSSEETDSVAIGHITRVFKKPFKLHDRVIRPGQVVVAKPKS
jgi:molecular chaperone GrpE